MHLRLCSGQIDSRELSLFSVKTCDLGEEEVAVLKECVKECCCLVIWCYMIPCHLASVFYYRS